MKAPLVALLLFATTGCLTFRDLPYSRSAEAPRFPSTVRVIRTDGTTQLLGGARQVGDTIHGVWPTPHTRYAIPVSQVARIEVRRFDRRRTAAVGGVAVVLGVALWLVVRAAERPVDICAAGGAGAPCPFP